MMDHPILLTFPFLKLHRPVVFGEWWLGPGDDFDGPWLSAKFEEAARRFLVSFRTAGGDQITGGALLARRRAGADGVLPSPKELQALGSAVGFATIDQNPYWSPQAKQDGWKIATSDNADLWAQPIDVDEGWITLTAGSRVATKDGGLNLWDPAFGIPAPLELPRPPSVTIDSELLKALYAALAVSQSNEQAASSRLHVVIRWLLRSWRNTPSLTWDDRVVFVKIATEALADADSTAEAAQRIENTFERAAAQPGEGLGIDDLLWDPEAPRATRHWTTRSGVPKTEEVSAFAHWYWALADARNALVHGEREAVLEYDEPGSPYNGPLIEVADRVIREAIGVLLGECGYPHVWRRGTKRATFRAAEELRSAMAASAEGERSGEPTEVDP